MPNDIFTPLVDALGKSAKAAYPFIRSLALDTTTSKASIVDQLSKAGYPLRRQTTLDLIDLIRNKADLTQFTRTFGPNAIIPDALHSITPHMISGGNTHQYTVATNSANPLIPEAIFVNSDRPLSENEILGAAAASFVYDEESGMAADDLGEVYFSVEDARWIPGS